MFKAIAKMAYEAEGAWLYKDITDRQFGDIRQGFHGDGSVNIRIPENRDSYWIGEFAEPIPQSSYDGVVDSINKNWPEKWNNTCGFHIHISTKEIGHYTRLMDRSFYKIFLKDIEKELVPTIRETERVEFMRRLRGESTYCKKGWAADNQAIVSEKCSVRYFHLNFCWKLHKTMEIRVPPMMIKEDAIKTIAWITNKVENYLAIKRKVKTYNIEIEEKPLCAL